MEAAIRSRAQRIKKLGTMASHSQDSYVEDWDEDNEDDEDDDEDEGGYEQEKSQVRGQTSHLSSHRESRMSGIAPPPMTARNGEAEVREISADNPALEGVEEVTARESISVGAGMKAGGPERGGSLAERDRPTDASSHPPPLSSHPQGVGDS